LSEETPAEKPKKRRGTPKGSKHKPKQPKVKEPKVEAKPKTPEKAVSTSVTVSKTGLTPSKVSGLLEEKAAAAKAAAAKAAAAKTAEEEAAKKEYAIAVAEAQPLEAAQSFSDKYRQTRIFRREMGEPEFWLGKEGLVPLRPFLTQDEQEEISRKVQIPTDQSPAYIPEHILIPEFKGTSNYERGVADFKNELEEKLQHLKANPDSSKEQIIKTQEDLKSLDYLYENYYSGMNVFRTAKGGRAKLRE